MYLVAGPGRTGSVFLYNYLKILCRQIAGPQTIMIEQTHDATLQLAYETVVIHCRRKDLFEHTLSSVIAQYTNEWTVYTHETVSLDIDLKDFESKYLWNLRWFEAFEHFTRYHIRIDLYFEDFIKNPKLINQTLGLPVREIIPPTQQRPRGTHVVNNLHELKDFFQKLEKNQYLHSFPIEERDWSWQPK